MNSVSGVFVVVFFVVGFVLIFIIWGILVRYFNIFVVKVVDREMSLIFLVGIIFLFVIFLLNFFELVNIICCFSYCGCMMIWIMFVVVFFVKMMCIVSVF